MQPEVHVPTDAFDAGADAADAATRVDVVGAIRVRVPLRRPFVSSAGTWREVDAWIIRVRDDAGHDGFGEATLGPGASPTDLERLAVAVRSVVGTTPSQRLDAGAEADDPDPADAGPDEADPIERAVDAAIDAAMLDLGFGPRALEPGAVPRDDVAVNATIATEDLQTSVRTARRAVDRGFHSLKLKVGSERSTVDFERRIRAVRTAVGDAIEIRLDANGAWDPATAIDRARSVADLDIAYLEQPVASGRIDDLAMVRAQGGVAIAADESVTSVAAARALVDSHAVDVLVVKPSRVGGPRASVALAQHALAARVDVTISTLLETGVGVAAAARIAALLPDRGHAHGLATTDALESDLLARPTAVEAGRLAVPAPGLRLDDRALDRWTVERIGADG